MAQEWLSQPRGTCILTDWHMDLMLKNSCFSFFTPLWLNDCQASGECCWVECCRSSGWRFVCLLAVCGSLLSATALPSASPRHASQAKGAEEAGCPKDEETGPPQEVPLTHPFAEPLSGTPPLCKHHSLSNHYLWGNRRRRFGERSSSSLLGRF